MKAEVLNMPISDKMTPYIYTMSDGKSIAEKANIYMVIGMYAAKVISLEKAAELAGKSIWDFVETLKKYNVPWGEYSEESLNMDKITLASDYR